MKTIDLTGQRFGKLTVVGVAQEHPYNTREKVWECRCDCGNSVLVRGYSLRSGHTQSCGCLSVKTIIQRSYDNDYAKIHGLATSRIYKNYYAMRARCYNTKNQNYPRYGGKGIRVCDEWLNSFEAFYKWAMANGYDDTKTIDRINPDGDYTPDNCRFADASVQGFNRHTQSNNKTGHKGVCKANNGKYRAYIKKNGKQISLGSYETLDAAVQAREKAENELYKTEVVQYG